jgi:hypothetical protein
MMVGDNRDASLDARFFGFVPEENIVGKPMFTWMSLQGAFADKVLLIRLHLKSVGKECLKQPIQEKPTKLLTGGLQQ